MKLSKYFIFLAVVSLLAGRSAYGDFGCHFIVDSRLTYSLDAPQKKLSFRFTCQQDIGLMAASVYCEKALNSPAYLLSIREDVGGMPSTEILGETSIIPKTGTWATLPMPNVSLSAGKVYHLVLEWDSNRGGVHQVGVIGPRNCASFAFTDKPNHLNPFDETKDPALEMLAWEDGAWKVLGHQPLYALHGGGQTRQGDPYDSPMEMPIHGNGTPGDEKDDLLQGEALHPHCNIPATGFVIRVKKVGHPTAPLNYRVYSNDYMKHVTQFSYSGKALEPGQVGTDYQWVTVGFGPTRKVRNFEDQCTYIAFQTDSGKATSGPPGCEDCYVLSGATNSGNLSGASELSFDGGAHLSRAAFSRDGGATFQDEFEGDANVVLLGPDCHEKEDNVLVPIPAPSPLPRSLNP
jgi:hypothetical protein